MKNYEILEYEKMSMKTDKRQRSIKSISSIAMQHRHQKSSPQILEIFSPSSSKGTPIDS